MSAILSADDLNDFISPGVACIKPVETLPQKETASENPYEVTKEDKVLAENLPPAQISLTDCLACSGCVTSAEAVLISMQSHAEVLNTLDAYTEVPLSRNQNRPSVGAWDTNDSQSRIFVASISPQVRASLAATYGITGQEATYMVDQFLSGPHGLRSGGKHGSGFTWVVDTNIMREAVQVLTTDEALTGTFLKTVLSKTLNVPVSRIWHLAVMPCFDKKLEASREELTDVSWNITKASSRGISLPSLPLQPLPCAFSPRLPDETLDAFLFSKHCLSKQTIETGTSGGYLHHVLLTFQAKNPGSEIVTQRGRNADVVEYTLVSSKGETLMKAARYYGFRNIQNLVRKLKPARVSRLPGAKTAAASGSGNRRQPMSRNAASFGSGTDYAYIEVMACPGGCTNGGGQIRIEDAREASSNSQAVTPADTANASSKPSPHEQRSWLAHVDEAYYSAESDTETEAYMPRSLSISKNETRVHGALRYWSDLMGISLSKMVYTTYREVESDVGKSQKEPNDTKRVVELAGKIGGGW
ncbi:hypothetical protein EYZ11_001597 [Aspergillus tanneri]|uniref:Cytosolic Fe-S cluster assembly factor NAR1 n=1 Tax=Aspergillus tanneri TaxID=1220188 RepID=A0A4S3JTG9_9EURO|nr:hypothetical protein EYZ11_001597 [Aspergillus tanneri]